ncbi:hypothetical protein SLE2022_235220 [Rubroshorea leprosula]
MVLGTVICYGCPLMLSKSLMLVNFIASCIGTFSFTGSQYGPHKIENGIYALCYTLAVLMSPFFVPTCFNMPYRAGRCFCLGTIFRELEARKMLAIGVFGLLLPLSRTEW